MGIRIRLVAAAMAATALTAMVGAVATASATPASPTATADTKKEPDKDATVTRVAAGLHVSVAQLTTALDHLKQALAKGTDKQAAVAAFAKELGVTVAEAEKVLDVLSSAGRDQKPEPRKDKGEVSAEFVKLLAAELHISAARAERVLTDLDKVKSNGEDVVKDPAFIAIARGLHITPQWLLDALVAVKKKVVDQQPKKPSGSPTK